MKSNHRLFSNGAIAACALLSSSLAQAAPAASECPMLPQAEVIKAFNQPEARLNQADPAGMCNWTLEGGTLVASIQKRPKASEAKVVYDSFKSTMFAGLTRNASVPKVGQQAYFGMSPTSAQRQQAGFIALQDDTLFVLNYYANDALADSVATPLLELGRIGTERRGEAAQSFGQCEWFTSAEVTRILGPGKQTIQRLGGNHCIASILPSVSALTVMTDKNTTENSLGNIRKRSATSCTVLPLEQFGPEAHATFACPAPANKAMSVRFLKNGTAATIIFSPGQRAATESDLKALDGVLQRAYERLGK